MPPQNHPPCRICNTTKSNHTCATCKVVYCSIPYYKQYKSQSCSATTAGSTDIIGALPEPLVQPSPKAEGSLTYDSAPPIGTVDGSPVSKTSSVVPILLKPTEYHCATAPIPTESTSTLTDSKQPRTPEPDSQVELDTPKPPLRTLTSLNWPYVPEESAYLDPLKWDDPKSLQLHHCDAIATAPAIRTILSLHPQLPALLRSLDALRGPEREDALQRALGVSIPDLDLNAHAHVTVGRPAEEDIKTLRALAEAIEAAAVCSGKEDALGLDWEG